MLAANPSLIHIIIFAADDIYAKLGISYRRYGTVAFYQILSVLGWSLLRKVLCITSI